MGSLVIVESPAKAKTISKILGKDYNIKASIGHVKDLPTDELGVDVKNNFKPLYQIIPGKEKILKELKKEAKSADSIYLATDPDREGEAIAYHIAEEIKNQRRKQQIYRIIFHEITKKAVEEAIQNPGNINLDKVAAQQARRILDRLVGYNLSPFLWRKVRKGLSAGRVQSVALRLIVEREKEIQNFIKEEYWTIEALFQPFLLTDSTSPVQFKARLYKYRDSLVINRDRKGNERFLIKDGKTANEIIALLQNEKYRIAKVETKLRKKSPPPPFITSTLQQEAARRFKFQAAKTMKLAQELYEGIELGKEGSFGLITYIRTDSVTIAHEAQRWARDYIKVKFGREFIPEKLPQYKNKKTSQEAHEAIRPTYPDKSPEQVKPFLTKDQYNLYSLIWNRFIASQMAPAQLEQTVFIIEPIENNAGDLKGTEFRASGTVIKFLGFMSLYTEAKDEATDEDGVILPSLPEGLLLTSSDMEAIQHFTQPPPRYTEATLVKTLEEKGIGRPSTYATILSTIQDRKYVKKEEGKFIPTELGVIVSDLLVAKFPELMDVNFTAKMEDNLDEIENSRLNWVEVVKDFFIPFQQELDIALKETNKVKPVDIPTDLRCERCGQMMVNRWGKHGRFLACSGYPKCKNTKEIIDSNLSNEKDFQAVEEICDKCGKPMIVKNGKFGEFLACTGYPNCKNTKPITLGISCPLDGGEIIQRKTKRGKFFWSCSNYPECTFASWYRPISQACPKCGVGLLCEKIDKHGKTIHFCSSKDCDYSEEVQLSESLSEK
ncbi:MAG: type I DNA topoisomerase [Thermodesulfovibrionales bacterium]|nr:type I DNA topoisomerase [Thermodesulfovibrionales bacterium]